MLVHVSIMYTEQQGRFDSEGLRRKRRASGCIRLRVPQRLVHGTFRTWELDLTIPKMENGFQKSLTTSYTLLKKILTTPPSDDTNGWSYKIEKARRRNTAQSCKRVQEHFILLNAAIRTKHGCHCSKRPTRKRTVTILPSMAALSGKLLTVCIVRYD